ncbi:hypothetical protein V6N13_135408 [Hibiscus sabdariffa]|uniref:Uncharacterized protein n=1 Tax=Hibiscus sabdariffa TaxID=183260 RepID=A0ABR2R764_9ROSI
MVLSRIRSSAASAIHFLSDSVDAVTTYKAHPLFRNAWHTAPTSLLVWVGGVFVLALKLAGSGLAWLAHRLMLGDKSSLFLLFCLAGF